MLWFMIDQVKYSYILHDFNRNKIVCNTKFFLLLFSYDAQFWYILNERAVLEVEMYGFHQ
jgi:hypothetical protein